MADKVFNRLFMGQPIKDLYIPTAGGKTGVIPVWLCTVLLQLKKGTLAVPRRMYYAVDRRIVVDQSEVVARDLQVKVQQDPELFGLLRAHSMTEGLVVSVLRGQRVTEQEAIISDPSAFAIVLCTPDMVFSRLLFSAYGCSHRIASREAGLVGQDSYIVLDEAHMSPASANVLHFVSELQRSESARSAQANPKPFHFTCMTATPRSLSDSSLCLDEEDLAQLSTKLKAHKAVKIVEVVEKEFMNSILNIIEQQATWARLIIYVEKPANAARLCKHLQKNCDGVKLLTGTMRGLEKSQIDLSAFQPGAAPGGQHILICTSAGEVGLNISADFLITEASTMERLAQRFGRLNRWAETEQAFGYIVRSIKETKGEEQSETQKALKATISYLKSLPHADGWMDMSTHALYTNPIPEEAFGPERASLSLNEAMIAQLANTSAVSVPISNFIRGANFEYNVNLAIRKKQEIDALLQMSYEELQEYVAAVPVANNELFKDMAHNLKKVLSDHGEMLFVSSEGVARFINFSDDELNLYKLAGGTLYISDEHNLIDEQGMFSESGGGKGDVFAELQNKYRRFIRTDAGFLCLDTQQVVETDTTKDLLNGIEAPTGFKAKVIFEAANLIYVKLVQKQKSTKMSLAIHSNKAKEGAEGLLNVLPEPVTENIVRSSLHHDDGKAHWLWQLASKGSSDGEALAKVGYFNNPALLGGLRHELVSVLNNDLRDLEVTLPGTPLKVSDSRPS